MSIWKRLRTIFRSHRDASPDDPAALRESLDESYLEQVQLLQNVRRGVADVATSRKRVEIQISRLEQQGKALDEQARAAVDRGDNDAARRVLTRRVSMGQAIDDLEKQHDVISADEARLTETSRDIEEQIEAFRVRKDTLSARHTAAEARSRINSSVTGISGEMGSIGQAMRDAEQHTRELESRADAVDELVDEGLVDDLTVDDATRRERESERFDRELEALSGDDEVERQLEALRQESPETSGERRGEDKV